MLYNLKLFQGTAGSLFFVKKGEVLMRIVAIGGGEVSVRETWPIDQEIVHLAKAGASRGPKPNVLFIPTASGDNLGYCEMVRELYESLGCRFFHLKLLERKMTDIQIRRKIEMSDIVYVGGGDTVRMLGEWKNYGVDKLLRQAGERGAVLAGLSAGAICWSWWGPSDSLKERRPNDWMPIKVNGLGFLPLAICPHYDVEGEWRRPTFKNMLKKSGGVGIALQNYSALEIIDRSFRIFSFGESGKAFRVFWKGAEFIEEELETSGELRLISSIL